MDGVFFSEKVWGAGGVSGTHQFITSGHAVKGLGFRVQGLGFRVQGLGFRASVSKALKLTGCQ